MRWILGLCLCVLVLPSMGCAQRKANREKLRTVSQAALIRLIAPNHPRDREYGHSTLSGLSMKAAGIGDDVTFDAMQAFIKELPKAGSIKWIPIKQVRRDPEFKDLTADLPVLDILHPKGLDRLGPAGKKGAAEVADSLDVDLLLSVECKLNVIYMGGAGRMTFGEADHMLRLNMNVQGWGRDGDVVFVDTDLPAVGSKVYRGLNGQPTKRDNYADALDDVFRAGARAVVAKLEEARAEAPKKSKKKRKKMEDDDEDEDD